jgi:hypothetical protein
VSTSEDDETGAVPSGKPAPVPSKAERRAARAAVDAYHEAELGKLIERVRDGLARYDAGEIDAFELDDLVHHYQRATQKLWSFCTGSGGHVATAARTLEWLREQGELPDWWEEATPRRLRPAAVRPIDMRTCVVTRFDWIPLGSV